MVHVIELTLETKNRKAFARNLTLKGLHIKRYGPQNAGKETEHIVLGCCYISKQKYKERSL